MYNQFLFRISAHRSDRTVKFICRTRAFRKQHLIPANEHPSMLDRFVKHFREMVDRLQLACDDSKRSPILRGAILRTTLEDTFNVNTEDVYDSSQ